MFVVKETQKYVEYSDGIVYLRVSKRLVERSKETVEENINIISSFLKKMKETGFMYSGDAGVYMISILNNTGKPVIIEFKGELERFIVTRRTHRIDDIEETITHEWVIPYDYDNIKLASLLDKIMDGGVHGSEEEEYEE